jgi:hypothetical protein
MHFKAKRIEAFNSRLGKPAFRGLGEDMQRSPDNRDVGVRKLYAILDPSLDATILSRACQALRQSVFSP